jgi:CheY-like chemotaxis protein
MPERSARVAVVEDEQAQRGAITAALQRAGYTVGAWADGGDVASIAAFRPDLAILDVSGSGPAEGPEPDHDSHLSTCFVQSLNSQE